MDWKRLSNHLRILVMVRQIQEIFVSGIERLFEVFFYLFNTPFTLFIESSFILNKNMACWRTQNVIAIGDQWIPAGAHQQ